MKTAFLLLIDYATTERGVFCRSASVSIASNRGALPETLGDAGILLDIPAKYGPTTRNLPRADEIAPWVRAICQLWDEPELYRKWQNRGFVRAERWKEEKITDRYEKVLRDLLKNETRK